MRADEDWRHECECRHVFALRRINRNRALAYLQTVRDKRGAEAATKLQEGAAALWAAEQKGK